MKGVQWMDGCAARKNGPMAQLIPHRLALWSVGPTATGIILGMATLIYSDHGQPTTSSSSTSSISTITALHTHASGQRS